MLRRLGRVTTACSDVRYAWRTLRRRPSFMVVSLVTLAFGIGLNTAVFSVFYAVLMRPLPYGNPEELGTIWSNYRTGSADRRALSGQLLREVESRSQTFAGLAGLTTGTDTVSGAEPEQVRIATVTENFFEVLGVHAAFGRTFTKGEDPAGPALVSHGFFNQRYGGSIDALGRDL